MTCIVNGKLFEIVAESRTISAACLAKFSVVARFVTLSDVSCDLSRNAVERQVERKNAQFDYAFRVENVD